MPLNYLQRSIGLQNGRKQDVVERVESYVI